MYTPVYTPRHTLTKEEATIWANKVIAAYKELGSWPLAQYKPTPDGGIVIPYSKLLTLLSRGEITYNTYISACLGDTDDFGTWTLLTYLNGR